MRLATMFAATVLFPAAVSAQTPAEPPTPGTLLDVAAEGRTTRVPDVATIRAGVVAQATTAAAALADQATRMARVLDSLKRAGVAFGEVRAISNLVGPRDRDAWDIPLALRALAGALAAITSSEWKL